MPMKTLSISLAFLTLILLLCYLSFSLLRVKLQRDGFQAERLFYRNAATQICLDREAVIYAAETQGFLNFERGEGMDAQMSTPEFTIRSVQVYIEPGLFIFAPRSGTTFYFGQDGCWIPGE